MARNDKSALPGGTAMLVLALLKEREMYGYQIIEELEKRSNQVFHLQEGTLYPLLHQSGEGQAGDSPGSGDTIGPPAAVTTTLRRQISGLWMRRRRMWQVYSRAVTAILVGA